MGVKNSYFLYLSGAGELRILSLDALATSSMFLSILYSSKGNGKFGFTFL